MSFLASILPSLIVLGILIIIHEFGHFIACRMTGVDVEKFSIGFGPEIISWQGKKTRYAVSLFPLGGFVKPAGESVSELDSAGPRPGDYLAAPLWARILIVVAGVAMNYLLAYILFFAIFVTGRPIPGTTVQSFVEGYPAAESGMKEGDEIIRLAGRDVATWKELTESLEQAPEGELEVLVRRGADTVTLNMTPKSEIVPDLFGQKHKVRRIGIAPDPKASKFEKYPVIEALKVAWETEVFLTAMTHKAIFYLIMGKLSVKTVSGPIGIITMTGTAAQLGLPYVLQLTATLSISLAVINLLPIPALDGGHLLFLLIEAVSRRRVSLKVQERATQVGFVLLLTLMVFIVYNDIVNLDVISRIKGLFGG
jgi:regulator of sigma E protease